MWSYLPLCNAVAPAAGARHALSDSPTVLQDVSLVTPQMAWRAGGVESSGADAATGGVWACCADDYLHVPEDGAEPMPLHCVLCNGIARQRSAGAGLAGWLSLPFDLTLPCKQSVRPGSMPLDTDMLPRSATSAGHRVTASREGRATVTLAGCNATWLPHRCLCDILPVPTHPCTSRQVACAGVLHVQFSTPVDVGLLQQHLRLRREAGDLSAASVAAVPATPSVQVQRCPSPAASAPPGISEVRTPRTSLRTAPLQVAGHLL